jgi:hypothetical protein
MKLPKLGVVFEEETFQKLKENVQNTISGINLLIKALPHSVTL